MPLAVRRGDSVALSPQGQVTLNTKGSREALSTKLNSCSNESRFCGGTFTNRCQHRHRFLVENRGSCEAEDETVEHAKHNCAVMILREKFVLSTFDFKNGVSQNQKYRAASTLSKALLCQSQKMNVAASSPE